MFMYFSVIFPCSALYLLWRKPPHPENYRSGEPLHLGIWPVETSTPDTAISVDKSEVEKDKLYNQVSKDNSPMKARVC